MYSITNEGDNDVTMILSGTIFIFIPISVVSLLSGQV